MPALNKNTLTDADIRTKFITLAIVGANGDKWNIMTQIAASRATAAIFLSSLVVELVVSPSNPLTSPPNPNISYSNQERFLGHRDRKRSTEITERKTRTQASDFTFTPAHQRENLPHLVHSFSLCVSLCALCEKDWKILGMKYSG